MNLDKSTWKPKKSKNCTVCGAGFLTYRSNKIMCTDCRKIELKRWNSEYSKKHKQELIEYAKAYYKEHKQKVYEYNKKRAELGLHKTVKRICKQCGGVYYSDRKESGKFCSPKCSGLSRKVNIPKKCLWCGNEFYVSVSQEKLRNRRCCSKKCGARYNMQLRKGDKNNFWRGGVSSENRKMRYSHMNKDWRESVFQRDNYTCQKCGGRGSYINAHHIKPWAKYPDLRFEVSNGITLCKARHKQEHIEMRKNENNVSRLSV